MGDFKEYLNESKVPQFSSFVDEFSTDDYPYGRLRTTATWKVETKGKKSRVTRVTVNPKTGLDTKPKSSVYGEAAKIGIGTDGRTYLLIKSAWAISIMAGDMKYSVAYVSEESDDFATVNKAFA